MAAVTRYGYLGPEGTFTQMALLSWTAAHGGEHVPFGSVDSALDALRRSEIDAAMVPIENSVEGGVSATLDALASGDPLVVIGEVNVPITFVLAARAGVSLADIGAVWGITAERVRQIERHAIAKLRNKTVLAA